MGHDHRTGPTPNQRLLKHRVGEGCYNKMELESLSNPTKAQAQKEAAPPRKLPKIQFRVLIAGRANAGKTSILQRVCETTESPEIYRTKVVDGEETREKIDHLGPTSERGQHTISDELIFANHRGYVFHDSCGFESGSTDELQRVQAFVSDRSQRKELRQRLHAIWYCIPMDNNRPGLDIAPFYNICPDKNVPVILLFTKYEAFRRNVEIDLDPEEEADDLEDLQRRAHHKCQEIFEAEYLSKVGETPFVRLEGMDKPSQPCDELLKTTMEALNPVAVGLMLLTVQKANLKLSVQHVVKRTLDVQNPESQTEEHFMKIWLGAFPMLWFDYSYIDFIYYDEDDLAEALLDLAEAASLSAYNSDDYSSSLYLPRFQTLLLLIKNFVKQAHPPTRVKYGTIVTVIVLRHAALTYTKSQVTPDQAFQQACELYFKSDTPVKVEQWFTASPDPTDQEMIEMILSCEL